MMGTLTLAMFVAGTAALAALVAGHSLLTAFAIYSAVGVMATLLIASIIIVTSVVRPPQNQGPATDATA